MRNEQNLQFGWQYGFIADYEHRQHICDVGMLGANTVQLFMGLG
jgi:hypothetical protein